MPSKLDPDKTAVDKALEMMMLLMGSNHAWSTSQLKERLNCSTQTISRVAEAIERRVGAQLLIEKNGKENTYRLEPKAKKGRLYRNNMELRYLQLCRDLAEPYLPKQILESTDRDLRRLEQFLGDESNEPQHNRPFAFLSQGFIDYTPHYDTIDLISEAIEEKEILELECKVLGQKKKEQHLFAPSVIAGMNGALYVLGVEVNSKDKSAGDICFFAIHRITKVTSTGKQYRFAMPQIEFDQYGLPWHEPRTYVIHFKAGKTAEWVQERVWSKNQVMRTLDNGDLELQLTTTAEPELLSWVRSFGSEAELVKQTDSVVSTSGDSIKLGATSGLMNPRFPFGTRGVVGVAIGILGKVSIITNDEPEASAAQVEVTDAFKQACAQIKGEL